METQTAAMISVIISSYNRADYIINAIDSLYNQTVDKNGYEIIVVDNNSTDNTEELCRNYIASHGDANIHFLKETSQGSSYSRNAGAHAAKGDLFTFIDDDAVAFPDFLEKIRRFFTVHPEASGLGGPIIPKYIPAEPEWMSYYVSSLVANFDYSDEVTEFSKNRYPFEPNMTVTREAFFAINGFDTNLPGVVGKLRIGGEGKDFFFRMKALGFRIFYDPEVKVHHVVEVKKLTSEYLYRVASGQGRGERVRVKKIGASAYYSKVVEFIFKLGAAIILGIGYALKGKPKKTWPVIKFRIDALKGLTQKF
ncbi:glycosyltransferase family 2 protein [Flavihumibacter sp.]|uniref:glycosyltransferase family 2 protein n=1 Tax=Flavihumibacter sp. TaxID=1913981 RepID=UPI002FC9D7F1